jgi:NAD dependent epimerase/dehydratase
MKALITGADGFIGSHLTEFLLAKGYHVRALSYYNSFNNWGWLEGLSDKKLEVVSGDIRDSNFCKIITKDIDIVFHLAALIAIPYSYLAPESYIDTNIKGTLNICQASKDNKVSRILVTSTSEVYGSALYVPIDEKHPKQPQSPYSASKIGADAIALSFYLTYDLPLTIVRPFNTYGPRQSARAIIPTIISQLISGYKKIYVGDLSPTRDFTFVKDTCKGFWEISNCNKAIGQEINISSNYEVSIKDLIDNILKILNIEVSIVQEKTRLRPQKSEVTRLWGDNTKIKKLTGFSPDYSLEKGLRETIEWFKVPSNLIKYKPDIYNL